MPAGRGRWQARAGTPELARLRHLISVEDAGDLTLESLAGRGGEVPALRRGGDDLATLMYTSGTTGKPKGAMLTHANVLANAAMGAELLPLVAGERVGMLLPLFHVNAQIVTCVIPMMVGCEVAMWERFSASTFWQTVAELEPVAVSAVPTILAAVLHTAGAPTGRTSLRYIICGAAPLSRELLEAFESRFDIRILEGYGLTESTCVSSLNPYYGVRKPGSIGLPVRGQEMKIVTPDGGPVDDGELGEIVVKGPNVMAGYLHNPEATATTIRDGWLHTGDVGYMDPDGYFFIVDRAKDMIIRGGENIYPREIEEVLYTHAGDPRMRRDRRARRDPRRRSPRGRRAETRRRARRRAAQSLGRRAPRGVQGAPTVRDPPRTPEDPDRQDQQTPPARRIRPLGTHWHTTIMTKAISQGWGLLVDPRDAVRHRLGRNQGARSSRAQCAGELCADAPARRQLDQKLALPGIRQPARVFEGGEESERGTVVVLHQRTEAADSLLPCPVGQAVE